jgi:hypothetical protein
MNYDLAEKENFIVYTLAGITYLPHYIKKNSYVKPGYGRQHYCEFTAAQLVNAGAITLTEHLFSRIGGVNGQA